MDLDEIKVEPSSNPRHEKTPVDGASSVPQDESRGLNEMTPEELYSLKKQLRDYAREDRWKEAEPIFNKYGEMVRSIPLTLSGDTVLLVATDANSINFVKGLLNLMKPQELEVRDSCGNTILFLAVVYGYREIVQSILEKNQNFALIKMKFTYIGRLPVHYAVHVGHHKIVEDLTSETLIQKMDSQDNELLFFLTNERGMYGVARNIFKGDPNVLGITKYGNETTLEMMLRKPWRELYGEVDDRVGYVGDGVGTALLLSVWDRLKENLGWKGTLESIGTSSFVSAIADALESGNDRAVEHLICHHLKLPINSNDETILHYVIRERHNSILHFILYFILEVVNPDKEILLAVDKDGNTVLHYAAYACEIEGNSSSLTAAAKIKNEIARFKKMEKIFPPELRTRKNKKGKTPKHVFVDKHKDLSRELKDTAKGIADSGMTVAALVATVAFAAVLTVPGDKTSPWFIVFILANAAALFTSSASILSFLSNFTTSRFADSEFVIALHPSLILGPILLLISIVTMVISFAATSFLIFEHTSKWAAYVVTSMGIFPILLFLFFQFSIFDRFFWSRFYHFPMDDVTTHEEDNEDK